jgi:hypothetical protein
MSIPNNCYEHPDGLTLDIRVRFVGDLLIKKGRAADEVGTLPIGGHTADWKCCFCDKEENIQLF